MNFTSSDEVPAILAQGESHETTAMTDPLSGEGERPVHPANVWTEPLPVEAIRVDNRS